MLIFYFYPMQQPHDTLCFTKHITFSYHLKEKTFHFESNAPLGQDSKALKVLLKNLKALCMYIKIRMMLHCSLNSLFCSLFLLLCSQRSSPVPFRKVQNMLMLQISYFSLCNFTCSQMYNSLKLRRASKFENRQMRVSSYSPQNLHQRFLFCKRVQVLKQVFSPLFCKISYYISSFQFCVSWNPSFAQFNQFSICIPLGGISTQFRGRVSMPLAFIAKLCGKFYHKAEFFDISSRSISQV